MLDVKNENSISQCLGDMKRTISALPLDIPQTEMWKASEFKNIDIKVKKIFNKIVERKKMLDKIQE